MMHLCALWQDTGDGEIDIEIPEGVGPGDTFEVSLDTGGGGGAADDGLDGLNIDALLQGASDDEEDEDEDEEEGPGVTMDMMVTCPEGTSAGQPILITTEWGADLEVVRDRQMTDWHTDPFRGPIRAVKTQVRLAQLIIAATRAKQAAHF